ncbi:hypothetical protein, partial [Methanoculleus sp.]|uniref:hypothetical protein n=1 Tax=Methanoculleus sp. TaxID=90427 RepID=UPI0025F712F9
MVTLKEFVVGKQIPIERLGTFKIKQNIFDFQPRTPNYEMDKSIDAYNNRPQINSGVNQMAMFIIGDKISFKSKDKQSVEWMEKWYKQRKRSLDRVIFRYVIETLVTGNPALEPAYIPGRNGEGLVLDNVFSVQDSSRIYVNNNKTDYPNYDYIYKVPMRSRGTKFKGRNVEYFRLSYITGDSFKTTWIWGIGYRKDELWVDPIGYSKDGLYGRGIVMAAIDDLDVLTQIIQNYATVARYRAIGKKIFTVTGEDGEPGEPEDMAFLKNQLENSGDRDHIIFNKKTDMKDLSYTGQSENMDFQANFLRQNIGSVVVPNYMTPWAGTTTYATANKASVPFELVIKWYKNIIITAFNDWIISNLRLTANPNLSDDLSFKFGDICLETLDEKITNIVQLYDRNTITLNELREYVGWPQVIGGDYYKKDLEQEPNFGFNSVPNNMDGDTPNGESFHEKETLKEGSQTIVKYDDLRGNNIKLIKTDSEYLIYRSKTLLKSFNLTERDSAISYYNNVKKNIKKSFDEFIESDKDKDLVVKKLYKDVKEQQYNAMTQVLQTIKNNPLDSNIINVVDRIFDNIKQNFPAIAVGAVLATLALNKSELEKQSEHEINKIDDVYNIQINNNNKLLSKNLQNQLNIYNQTLAQQIKSRITMAIASGESVDDLVKDLKHDFGQYKSKEAPEDWKIQRIARTELATTSAINQLSLLKAA